MLQSMCFPTFRLNPSTIFKGLKLTTNKKGAGPLSIKNGEGIKSLEQEKL